MLRPGIATSVCLTLVIIGALNWALVGVLGIDLVATLFGTMTMASRAIYALVGLAGVGIMVLWFTAGSTPPFRTPAR